MCWHRDHWVLRDNDMATGTRVTRAVATCQGVTLAGDCTEAVSRAGVVNMIDSEDSLYKDDSEDVEGFVDMMENSGMEDLLVLAMLPL